MLCRPLPKCCLLLSLLAVCPPGVLLAQVEVKPLAAPQLELDVGGFSKPVVGIAFSPSGRYLAAEGSEAVRIWDLTTGKLHATLRGYYNRASQQGATATLAFTPDERELIVGASDWTGKGAVRVYRMDNFDQIAEALPGHNGPVDRVAVSADGRWVATTGYHAVSGNRETLMWDWPKRELVERYTKRLSRDEEFRNEGAEGREEEYDDALEYFGFLGGSNELFSCGVDLEGWPTSSWEIYESEEQASPKLQRFINKLYDESWPTDPFSETEYYYYDLRFDLNQILISGQSKVRGRNKYWAGVWSLDNSRAKAVYTSHRYGIDAITLSRDGRWVASGDMLGDVHVWDARTGKQRYVFRSRAKAVYNVGLSADGGQLAFGNRPYGPGEWAANHYAALDRRFDLSRRVFLDGAPGDYRQPVTKWGDVELRNYRNETGFVNLDVYQGGRKISFYPMDVRLFSWSLVRGEKTGLHTPIVIGDYNGVLYLLEGQPDGRGRARIRREFLGNHTMLTAVSESTDGRLLATSSTDGVIRIYSLENVQPWADFDFDGLSIDDEYNVIQVKPHARKYGLRVGDQILSIDGTDVTTFYQRLQQNLMLVGEYRQGQRLPVVITRGGRQMQLQVTLERGKDFAHPLLSLYVDTDGQWVMWTPQGYYDASPRGDQLIGWRVNRGFEREAAYFPASQFRKQLYRPDVIDAILETGNVDEAIAAANRQLPRPPEALDFREAEVIEQIQPPKVSIVDPADGSVVAAEVIEVKVQAKSQNRLPVTDIKVMVNGRPGQAKAIVREPATSDGGVTVVTRRVNLLPGRNVITALASNRQATSSPASIVVTSRPQVEEPVRKPNLYMLAVGCSEYADESLNLGFAHKDAEQFAATWKAQQGEFYNSVETKLLTNADATPDNIRDGMDWLVDSVTQHDLAVVFLSAHGVRDTRGTYYLATHELDVDRLRSTGIPYSDVERLIEDLPCKVLMFVDTCHAGGITGRKSLVNDPWRDLVSAEVGAILFASSHPREESLENADWGHGAFTRALLDAFAGQDADVTKDGYLSVNELDLYLAERVKELTKGKQHPVTEKPSTIRNFNLAKLKSR